MAYAHHILSIDGTDASGKNSVRKEVQRILEERGLRTANIDPPFYDTETGKAVKDYLVTGFGDWTDRKLASLMYSVDRNWFYRSRFDEIFESGNTDVVIYNRNWLSSIFYQTTLIAPTMEDTLRFMETNDSFMFSKLLPTPNMHRRSIKNVNIPMAVLRDALMTEKDHETNPYISWPEWLCGTYREDFNAIQAESISVKNILADRLHATRNRIIRSHMKFVYDVEIEPYTRIMEVNSGHMLDETVQQTKNFVYDAPVVTNIVLVPFPQFVDDTIIANLKKREREDGQKMDRNERSAPYQIAVIDNIEYIKMNFAAITAPSNYNVGDYSVSVMDSAKLRKAFNFYIVPITREDGSLIPIPEIAANVLSYYDKDVTGGHPNG